MAVIDHLVYAVPDLAAAVDWFEESTGVRPAIGGSHDGRGTHNALVSCGDSYFELIAPDPGQPDPPASGQPRMFGIDDNFAPGGEGMALVSFAVRPDDGETFDDLANRMADAGHDPGPSFDGSRVTPTGDRISWSLTLQMERTMPFLIDWGDTKRPNTTAPGGIEIVDFAIIHPRPFDVLGVITALGIDLTVSATESNDAAPALKATVSGPAGDLDL